MSENRAKPAIRFAGFTDDWEQRKLGELAIFNPKAELPDEFEYVDLESVVGTEMLSHRAESKSSAPSRAQRLAQFGDLFYQTVRPYQKNNYLFEKPSNNYVFSTGYAQMRPLVDGYFLLCLVQNDSFVKAVLNNCTGTSYPAINSNDLAEIEVYIPNNQYEQKQIGAFFRSLDTLITLHQRKYDKLVKCKKAMLEKMFPKGNATVPEIRFAGFTDAWEQRKLGDEAIEIIAGGDVDKALLCEEGNYPVIANALSDDGIIGYYREQYRIKAPAVTVTGRGDVGHAKARSIDFTPVVRLLSIKTNHDPLFLENAINKLHIIIESTGIPQLTVPQLAKYEMLFPKTSEEEVQIGKFFSSLDTLITLHQRKLEKLKKIKKSCLEKMFV